MEYIFGNPDASSSQYEVTYNRSIGQINAIIQNDPQLDISLVHYLGPGEKETKIRKM